MKVVKQSKAFQANNFDFIRIVAATLVLFSHHFALTAQKEPMFFRLHSIGGLAVLCFFSISGYLVAQSWFTDPNFLRFTARRILRIWPALTLAVMISALIIGPFVTTLSASQYFNHPATWDYFNILRLKIYYVLPGVFENNPYRSSVNGSLWTIPIEVRCYAALGIAGLIGALRKPAFLIALSIAYLIWYINKSSPDLHGFLNYERELSAYFLMGATIYCISSLWKGNIKIWLGMVLFAATTAWLAELQYTALLIALPFLTICFGVQTTAVICRAGRWGDPSYGLYLFAFPIQQTVIAAYPFLGFASSLLLSLSLTTIAAYGSWHLLEKNALRLKPHPRPRHSHKHLIP